MMSVNMKYLRHFCFLVLLKSAESVPRKMETITLGSSIRQPGKSMRRVVAGTSSESKSFNYQLNRYAIAGKVAVNRYCKNTNSAVEVEILFKLDMESRSSPLDNWWRFIPRGSFAIPQSMSKPVCSQLPNARIRSTKAISEHEYFQSRIFVPIVEGERKVFLTEYETFKHRPAWKAFLECECVVTTRGWSSEVCREGNIYFSKGVGGNASFFVHARNSSGNFKVVAHICFR